jgi:4-alpha-glucanotransferase
MALFNWLTTRGGGVLLHPTALPGPTGIGTLGEAATHWVDLLAQMGAKYWQVLPLGPTGYGDSPYQSFSAFAGNPYLIDLTALVGTGLLKVEDLEELNKLGETKVDFGAQYHLRFAVLRKAYANFVAQGSVWSEYGSFGQFSEKHHRWLDPYAHFMALKDAHGGAGFATWEPKFRTYASALREPRAASFDREILAYKFWQYLFWGQWQKLKGYANSRGIHMIGDIPIFVAADSADLWSQSELFDLDEKGQMAFVAGVPPDYFATNGQRWGNPLYLWSVHEKSDFAWWFRRLERAFELFDVIRIDHFRGFYDFWKIPATSVHARTGEWAPGPGLKLFEALAKRYPDAKLIAEDLGELHDGVRDFVAATGLPGMNILQFGFGGDAGNLQLPHNAKHNQVCYTGTHDNATLRGWFDAAPEHVKSHFLAYFGAQSGTVVETGLRAVMASVARLAIVPAQDLLGLGADARFNTPGEPSGNWQWRMSSEQMASINSAYLRGIFDIYGRV